MIRFILGLGLSVALSACASAPPARTTQSPPPPRAPTAVSVIPSTGLAPQALNAGECGLFLWAQTDINKLVFFSKGQTNRAVFKVADATYNLSARTYAGNVFGQFLTRMVYGDGTGGIVELTFESGEELIGGQRIEGGLITRTSPDGWQVKLPVLGVRACLPE
ncbi:MAG: hypothetical protein AAGJ84_01780 [Pseudomonadota bacterium]